MSAKHKILIVDDKEQNLVALEKVLTECNAEVVKATSGNEALKASLSEDFALAILDVNMPEMNGYELAEFLAGAEKTKNLPIIFLSAEYSDDMHILKAYESGGIDFVAKPFNPYYLLSKVNVFLKLDSQKNELLDMIEIEKSKNYLESILRSVNDFIIVVTLDGNINNLNNIVCTKLGYEYNNLIGNKVTSLFTLEVQTKVETLLLKYSGGQSGENLQYLGIETFIRKNDGLDIPVILSITPLISEIGIIQGAVFTATDITERKKIEEELRKEKERAEKLSRIKSNFLANMSHELRTPMVGILGFSELLASVIEDSEQKQFAEMIHKGGTRLMRTLNQILDISLVESDKLELKISEFDIVSLINDVIHFFDLVAEKKSLYLKIDTDFNELILKQDIGLTRQVLNNLINNAIKFTKNGGVSIKLNKELIEEKEFVVIRVIDTGIGIPSDKIDLIWEEFRQVSEGEGRSFEGTGLGLSLTKKFVELLGGKIIIEESTLEKGSTFKLLLPVALNDTANFIPVNSETSVDAVVYQSNKNETKLEDILYVEDDFSSGLLVKNNIKDICNIDIVTTGEEAVEIVKTKKYKAILMDINLGTGINGVTAAKEIRLINGYKNVPIVAITAFAMVGDKERFLEYGFNHYISKPFVKNEIVELVKIIVK
jgi:PAS domain S-box-containing protein